MKNEPLRWMNECIFRSAIKKYIRELTCVLRYSSIALIAESVNLTKSTVLLLVAVALLGAEELG